MQVVYMSKRLRLTCRSDLHEQYLLALTLGEVPKPLQTPRLTEYRPYTTSTNTKISQLTSKILKAPCDDAKNRFEADSTSISSLGPPLTFDRKHHSHLLDNNTGSAANLYLASLWLQDCMENHEYCQVVQGDVLDLPRRVIDVSDPQKPCIRVEVQQKEQYLTLSYCWGEGRRLLTKIETIAEYEKGIPLDKLPRTFKDAIDLTHYLGFRYLWIDALCIIQDSKEDFERETSQMGRIYRDCSLTISAAGGSNADSGLFVKRDPRWYKPCRLSLSIKDANDDLSGTLFVLKATNEDPQPLHDRGWVLQEEVLSSRTLAFGQQLLSWRCAAHSLNESYPYEAPDKSKHKNSWASDALGRLRASILNPSAINKTRYQRENHFDRWYKVIQAYNSRSLTYPLDRFPAISGLASLLAKAYDCTYLAGLWKEDLQIGLVWFLPRDDWRSANSSAQKSLWQQSLNSSNSELNYIAPTWSWASSPGFKIEFVKWESNHAQLEGAGAQLISAHCGQAPQSLNPFGAVTSGYLELRGRLEEAVLRPLKGHKTSYDGSQSSSPAFWKACVLDSANGEIIGDVALEKQPVLAIEKSLPVWLLCTLVREKYGKWQITCLVLVPDAISRNQYRRIGLIVLHEAPSSWGADRYAWTGESPELKKWKQSFTTLTIV